MNKNRIEAFSDGVLAIIITIMVLEFKIPHSSDWIELKKLIPVFVSYLMSFINIGIYWGNHHHLLQSVKRVNGSIIWANLNLLFWLSLIPFATGWMGENNFASNTVAIYAINLLFCGGSYTILKKVVEKNAHNKEQLKIAFQKSAKKELVSVVSYIISIPLAFYYPLISGSIFLLVALVWIIPDKKIEEAFFVE
jgi:uncharacterized membrane protein